VDAKVDEIGRYYDEKDYANFTIQVHSLKSTSRIIGALDISERAWELEQAGDRKDENYISKNTEDLLFDYLELGKRLKEILPMEEAQEDDSELDDISDDMLNDGIATLKEFAENMSYDDLIFVLDELSSYKLSSKDKQLLKDIRNHVEQLDWEGVLSCIEKRGGE
jgi:HPt (histidine-containing phosphotransfer) domain-containing protein